MSVISAYTEYTVLSVPCQALSSSHFLCFHGPFHETELLHATLGYPEDGWAMVKLTPIEQEMFLKAQPAVFHPCAGAWGRRGATRVRLKAARKPTLRRALEEAWRLAAPMHLRQQFDSSL